MKPFVILATTFLLIICNSNQEVLAQSDSVYEAWVARYNGPGDGEDKAQALAVDGDGNVYVTGWSYDSGTFFDYATIRYDASGIEEWVSRYDGTLYYGAYDLALDGSGNVYVTGLNDLGNGSDCTTIKYNALGAEQWVARYSGPENDNAAYALAVDGNANVYVTGFSVGSGTSLDIATIKYDGSGIQQWVARYDGPPNDSDVASSLVLDESGNVYITGYSIGVGSRSDYITIKYDASGVEQWVARYNGPANHDDAALALAVDGNGNVYVTGRSFGSGFDYTTIKYNASGVERWVARYNSNYSDDGATALALDESGNVYVTGTGFRSDYVTIKYDASGTEQWVAIYDGPGESGDQATALALDESGNVYVTGASIGSDYHADYATIKYDASGAEQWVVRYNGPTNSDDAASALALGMNGNVYVTGYSGVYPDYDFATIMYQQILSGVEAGGQVPSAFSIDQNYPNPFNPSTTIDYALPKESYVRLEVFDLLGERVSLLKEGIQAAGYHRVVFDAKGFASGVYFYRLKAEDFVDTKKLLLLR